MENSNPYESKQPEAEVSLKKKLIESIEGQFGLPNEDALARAVLSLCEAWDQAWGLPTGLTTRGPSQESLMHALQLGVDGVVEYENQSWTAEDIAEAHFAVALRARINMAGPYFYQQVADYIAELLDECEFPTTAYVLRAIGNRLTPAIDEYRPPGRREGTTQGIQGIQEAGALVIERKWRGGNDEPATS